MTKNELKELVKQHFNLVEANVLKFDKAELEDGSKVSNEEAGKFAVGQTLFIEDADGNMVKAPEGEHISTSGIQFILDKDSKITGLKYPDEQGEGDANLAEDEEKKGDKSDEGAFDARTDAEEEGYLDGEKDEKSEIKELIVSYKLIYQNTYNVIVMQIGGRPIFRNESFHLWQH